MSRHATDEDGFTENSVRRLVAHAIHDSRLSGGRTHHPVLGVAEHRKTVRHFERYSQQIDAVIALSPRRWRRELIESQRAAGIEAMSIHNHQEREA